MRQFLYDLKFKGTTIDSGPNFEEWKRSWTTRDMTRHSPKQENDDDCGVSTILSVYTSSLEVYNCRGHPMISRVWWNGSCNKWLCTAWLNAMSGMPLGRLTTLSLVSAEVQQPRPDTKSGRSLSLGLVLGKAKYKKDTLDCSSHPLTRLSLLITGCIQLSPS